MVDINKSLIKLVVFSFILSLMSCTDGGGEGDLVTPNHPTGSFLNGKVAGLEYESYTWRDGVTDENGEFIFAPGENITFSVGNITLGTTEAQENVTPVDLVPEKADGSISPEAINMTRFLMSIDEDGNSSNGIEITEETSEALAESSLDFNSPDFDAEAQAIIESLGEGEIISEEEGPRGLVSDVDAEIFLEETIAEIEAEEAAAEAEEAAFECNILSPKSNVVLVQGQSLSVIGFAKGGSGRYTYEWTLGGQAISTALSPGKLFSSLTPGTYELQFKVVDSDGVQGSDQRLVTVLDKTAYGPIPTKDEATFFVFSYSGDLSVNVNESFIVQAVISKGNPPFYYSWTFPAGVNYSYRQNPLDAVFTFPSAGVYRLTVFMKDTVTSNGGPDTWSESLNVTVLP